QSGPSPDTTSIQLWWRASDAQALFDKVKAAGVRIHAEPFDGPFGRTFTMADPDGYRITVYEKDQPLFWPPKARRSEEHTSELQSRFDLVCRLLLEKKK